MRSDGGIKRRLRSDSCTGERLIGLIWAQAANGVIGRDNAIPWRIPADLAHFREVTGHATVVMGRRTWESLPARFRPLPGRRNVVLTRDPAWVADGAEPSADLLAALHSDETVWVMGGSDVYRAALPHADVLEITELSRPVEGDTYAPGIPENWILDRDGDWQESGDLRYRWRRYRSS